MRLPLPATFPAEAAAFNFRWCCEDCAHFDPPSERCGHFWPNAEHRQAHYADPRTCELVFCREFEFSDR